MRASPFDRFQEISRNFKRPPGELKQVPPKAVIYEGSVEGRLGAPTQRPIAVRVLSQWLADRQMSTQDVLRGTLCLSPATRISVNVVNLAR
jgi:hypothetical protein